MFDVILLLAGKGERTNLPYNKVYHKIRGRFLFEYAIDSFKKTALCNNIILVHDGYLDDYVSDKVIKVRGGLSRMQSVLEGMRVAVADIVLIHDGARCLVDEEDIKRVYYSTQKYKCAYLGKKIYDTIRNTKTGVIDKNDYILTQTPQGVDRKRYIKLLESTLKDYPDDVSLVEDNLCVFGITKVELVETSKLNLKVTVKEDLEVVEKMLESIDKVGNSIDVHQFKNGCGFVLAGVNIPYDKAIIAHSDGDVVYHAVAESIIGALGEKDLGSNFSDTLDEYKNVDSKVFMIFVKNILSEKGYTIINIDILVMLEKVLLSKYRSEMIRNIGLVLEIDETIINMKYTKGESLGIVGEDKGIVVYATCLLRRKRVYEKN